MHSKFCIPGRFCSHSVCRYSLILDTDANTDLIISCGDAYHCHIHLLMWNSSFTGLTHVWTHACTLKNNNNKTKIQKKKKAESWILESRPVYTEAEASYSSGFFFYAQTTAGRDPAQKGEDGADAEEREARGRRGSARESHRSAKATHMASRSHTALQASSYSTYTAWGGWWSCVGPSPVLLLGCCLTSASVWPLTDPPQKWVSGQSVEKQTRQYLIVEALYFLIWKTLNRVNLTGGKKKKRRGSYSLHKEPVSPLIIRNLILVGTIIMLIA